MSAKSRGSAAELKVRDIFLADGYYVQKAGGSLGVADLIALAAGPEVVLIQVKGYDRSDSTDWNELFELAKQLSANAVWATVLPRKPVRLELITGRRRPRTSDRPAVAWKE